MLIAAWCSVRDRCTGWIGPEDGAGMGAFGCGLYTLDTGKVRDRHRAGASIQIFRPGSDTEAWSSRDRAVSSWTPGLHRLCGSGSFERVKAGRRMKYKC